MDCSAWQGEVHAGVFARLKAEHGVAEFIPQLYGGGPHGTGPNPHLAAQVRAAREAGLEVRMGYVWPPSAWAEALGWWRDQDLGELSALALDVEGGPRARVSPSMVDGVRQAGLKPVIYTSYGEWEKAMGGTPYYQSFALAGVELWAAWYPAREWDGTWPEVIDLGRFCPRPWQGMPELVVGWQFAGTVGLYGSAFDLNLMRR